VKSPLGCRTEESARSPKKQEVIKAGKAEKTIRGDHLEEGGPHFFFGFLKLAQSNVPLL
jgi:hypothetical protein